jgi:quercetin dioxygenase-like cupin family protein
MFRHILLAAAIAGLTACEGGSAAESTDLIREAQAAAVPAQAPAPFSHTLGPLDGSHLKVTVVEVRYGPGQSSPPHSHPCPVIGYVVEGSLRTQVRGEPEAVYAAGQGFYEAANGAHIVSANASTDKPVRFLAYFTCDRETPLMQPVPDAAHPARP